MHPFYQWTYRTVTSLFIFTSGIFVGIRYCDTLVSLQNQIVHEMRPSKDLVKKYAILEDLISYHEEIDTP